MPFGEEFRLAKIKPNHEKVKDFAESPWLPWYLVVLYRFVLAACCLGVLVCSGFDIGPKIVIFYTNWAYISLVLYFITTAMVTLWYHTKGKHKKDVVMVMEASRQSNTNITMGTETTQTNKDFQTDFTEEVEDAPPLPEHEKSPKWYFKASWIIFNIAGCNAIVITCLYWSLLSSGATNVIDISKHLLNSILIINEVMISSIPVRILHLVYSMVLGSLYFVFTIIYWSVGGTDTSGEPYVYSYIDYGSHPGIAVAMFLSIVFVAQPLSQISLFCLYKFREFLAAKRSRVAPRDKC